MGERSLAHTAQTLVGEAAFLPYLLRQEEALAQE